MDGWLIIWFNININLWHSDTCRNSEPLRGQCRSLEATKYCSLAGAAFWLKIWELSLILKINILVNNWSWQKADWWSVLMIKSEIIRTTTLSDDRNCRVVYDPDVSFHCHCGCASLQQTPGRSEIEIRVTLNITKRRNIFRMSKRLRFNFWLDPFCSIFCRYLGKINLNFIETQKKCR